MSHRIDMESSGSGEQSNPQFLGPNKPESTPAGLYKAIKEGNKENFTSKLKQLCGQQKLGFSDSEVMDHIGCAGDTLLHVAVKYGKHDIAQSIADTYPRLIRRANVKGDTPLHVAARCEDSSLVEVILEAYAKTKLSSKEPDVLCRMTNNFGNTPLHEAVVKNNFAAAKMLYNANKLVAHYLNKEDKSPLYVAVESGNREIVDPLLKAPIENSEDIQKGEGKSPLLAGSLRINEAAEMLHDVNDPVAHCLNKEGKSPLYLAVENGNKKMVDLLLQAPIENREEMQKGKSPLLAAILRINQDNREETQKGNSTFLAASRINEGERKEERKPSNTETQGSTEDYLNILDRILKARPELKHIKDETGGTPLHRAALLGHLEGVRKLLEVDPASALEWNAKGYLPIHLASKMGHVSVVKEILKKLTWLDPIDLLNRKGQNILHMAAKNGKYEVVKYILKKKKLEPLLNEKDNKGNTPLHSASKYLHPKVLLLLTRDKRVDVNLVNNSGMTTLDVVLQQIELPYTFRQFLSSEILFYARAHQSEKGKRFGREGQSKRPKVHLIKEQASTLMLVTILVATVTFAAGFTVPGGFKDSTEDMKTIGIAALINRSMFKVFIMCDVVAMYSSTFAAFILLWAQLGDFNMAIRATHIALVLVAVALVTMSTAFMAAVHLIVRNLSWLAHIVIIMAIIFMSMFLAVFAFLMFPIEAPIPFTSYIARVIFRVMIPFSESYSKAREQIQTDPRTNTSRHKHTQAQTQDEQLQSDTFKYLLEKN